MPSQCLSGIFQSFSVTLLSCVPVLSLQWRGSVVAARRWMTTVQANRTVWQVIYRWELLGNVIAWLKFCVLTGCFPVTCLMNREGRKMSSATLQTNWLNIKGWGHGFAYADFDRDQCKSWKEGKRQILLSVTKHFSSKPWQVSTLLKCVWEGLWISSDSCDCISSDDSALSHLLLLISLLKDKSNTVTPSTCL